MYPHEDGLSSPVMPFGRWKDKALSSIDTPYLRWLLRATAIRGSLRRHVVAELLRRGETVEPPPPPPPRTCWRCGPTAEVLAQWHQMADGRRSIRGSCSRCNAWLGHLPQTEENVAKANAAASDTAILDTLALAAELGVELRSTGARVLLVGDGWRRATPELMARLRQCNHGLAKMLLRGRTTGEKEVTR